jgi:predicted nuclease of predicted toxin-antitoxin system
MFLVDEDLPRTLAPRLRDAGLSAEDVRDIGFGGRPDSAILDYARAKRRIIVTRDVAVADLTRLTRRARYGVVLVRFPQVVTTSELNTAIVSALHRFRIAQLFSAITVIEPTRVRTRRHSS